MRTLNPCAALAGTLLALTLLTVPAPAALAASPTFPIHLVKDCSMFSGDIPSVCSISQSDIGEIPIGSSISYTGPVVNGSYFLSSFVTVDAGGGSTATGYCIFDTQAVLDNTGLCTFWTGTGGLSGFTAILHVTIDASGLWHLDGTYHFAAARIWRTTRPGGR